MDGKRNEDFRRAIRRSGFHLVFKEIRRYRNEYGETAAKANEMIEDVFCHIKDFSPEIDNAAFADLKTRQTVVTFDLVRQEDGRHRAEKASIFDWEAAG
jgi:hypothetical protein